MEIQIPDNIIKVIEKLNKKGFEAYLVGGSVRDFLLDKEPKDWDITTNATPEEIISIFKKTVYENEFGTVGVITKEGIIEITTYRTESNYDDARHPKDVKWAKTLPEDLMRRDFTINAMAYDVLRRTLIDEFEGKEDLDKKIIRTVGDPKERFSEDALRMMRAIRFATVLDFEIEKKTLKTIKENNVLIQKISNERIRDELIKIIMSERAAYGIELLRTTGLLQYIIPELEEGYGCSQNKHHTFDCYTHNLKCLEFSARKNFNFYVRLASLLHDVGKPASKQGRGQNATFYNHEIIGAKMTKNILTRLKFPKKDIDGIVNLVKNHLFYYNVGEVTDSSVRRLIKNVGIDNMDDLIKLRMADRIGSGCPKAEPYKLRHLRYVIESVSKDPISVKMLKISGEDIMNILKIKPSKEIGFILNILLSEVLDDPKLNKKTYLTKRVKELKKEADIEAIAKKATESIENVIKKEDEMTKDKYWLS
jgi:poly(A) polymerase/tRNA nucleotidyltransferase (CCA-adding enzyme)